MSRASASSPSVLMTVRPRWTATSPIASSSSNAIAAAYSAACSRCASARPPGRDDPVRIRKRSDWVASWAVMRSSEAESHAESSAW